MRFAFLPLIFLHFSCKTISKQSDDFKSNQIDEFEQISCRMKLEKDQILNINVYPAISVIKGGFNTQSPDHTDENFSSSSDENFSVAWDIQPRDQSTQSEQRQIQVTTKDKTARFEINKMNVSLNFANPPQITIQGLTDRCSKILKANSVASKKPSCNAIGTAAQGWYVDGKLIKHSSDCHLKELACGTLRKEGWMIFDRSQLVEIDSKNCAWEREMPACDVKSSVKGWYQYSKLVARDDFCDFKSIQCIEGNRGTTWHTFIRRSPQFFASATCKSDSGKQMQASKPGRIPN
ncbi:MAG: hypothetical protein NT027_00435 [Proteobacteria bacterium]|nr:hypothetical protein [Pseudomonadota bacterium]